MTTNLWHAVYGDDPVWPRASIKIENFLMGKEPVEISCSYSVGEVNTHDIFFNHLSLVPRLYQDDAKEEAGYIVSTIPITPIIWSVACFIWLIWMMGA